MMLYGGEHIKKLRKEACKNGMGYIGDTGLIEFDKAVRIHIKQQNETKGA